MTTIMRFECSSCALHKDVKATSFGEARRVAQQDGWVIYGGNTELCARCAKAKEVRK